MPYRTFFDPNSILGLLFSLLGWVMQTVWGRAYVYGTTSGIEDKFNAMKALEESGLFTAPELRMAYLGGLILWYAFSIAFFLYALAMARKVWKSTDGKFALDSARAEAILRNVEVSENLETETRE